MSAYAAFRAKTPMRPKYDSPLPQPALLNSLVSFSNFKISTNNAIHTSKSIFLGLQQDNYILVEGSYELVVRRGNVLINNLHLIPEGKSFPIVVSGSLSVPVISAYLDEETAPKEKKNTPKFPDLLPDYEVVVEIRNLDTGLQQLGQYCPSLSAMYYTPKNNYTFNIITTAQDNIYGVYFNSASLKCLNALTRTISDPDFSGGPVVIIGSKNCGKSTFAKTLTNNLVLNLANHVALMDLDPSNSEYSIPGTLSVTVHDTPTFGVHFPKPLLDHREKDSYSYYGYDLAGNLPLHYMECCKQLWEHYIRTLHPQKIPLIVNTPGWVRGLGKDFLVELTSLFQPSHIVYLTHNDAIEAGDFEAEEFEAQDNPDDEVVAGLTCESLTTLKATRIAPRVSSALLKVHNRLAYFHRRANLKFDFLAHMLEQPPVRIILGCNPDQLSGFYYLGDNFPTASATAFAEATIMALCLIPEKSAPKIPQIAKLKCPASVFVCLCMVHSVTAKHANVYLPADAGSIQEAMLPYLDNHRIALVRGEGEIPIVELLMQGFEGQIPYVSTESKMRIGGIWKARKNLGRKNQG